MGGWCGGGQARAFLEATVVFIDIKGFTAGCAEMTVEQVRGPDAMLGGSESEMKTGSGRKRAAKPGSGCGVRRGTAGSDQQPQTSSKCWFRPAANQDLECRLRMWGLDYKIRGLGPGLARDWRTFMCRDGRADSDIGPGGRGP